MTDPMEFATALALETGALLQRFYNPAGIRASAKPDKTVVTEADLAADRLITESIHSEFPDDGIISEESSHFLNDAHSPTWVVDPLDGTTNFSLGLPVWGISIARLVEAQPEIGVLYFPRLDELYLAQRGSGAMLNRTPISTRAPDPAQPISFFACCSRTFRRYNVSVPYKPRIMGSSAYSFAMVARGSALLGFDATPKIWDLSAVWLLIKEAGGYIRPYDEKQLFPVNVNMDYNLTSFPTLAAATPELLEQGFTMIQKK